MSKQNILEDLPQSLRRAMSGYDALLPAMLPAFLDCDFDEALGFIQGALVHQERVHSEKSKGWKGTPTKVTYVERKSGSFVLGRKAVIEFEGTRRGSDRKEIQSINTGWVEFNGFNPEEALFEIALSSTVARIAEENIGNECFMVKAFAPAVTADGGDEVRYLADISPITPAKSSGSSKSSKSSQAKDPITDEDEVRDIIKSLPGSKAKAFKKDDAEVIADAVNELGLTSALVQDLAEEFDVPAKALSKAIGSLSGKPEDVLEDVIIALSKAL